MSGLLREVFGIESPGGERFGESFGLRIVL